jgi:hypothetical protein
MDESHRKRGSSRMREQGYALVSVWLDAKELAALLDLIGIARHWRGGRATGLRRLLCERAGIPFVLR